MSAVEMETLFEVEGERVRVKPRFRDGISWRLGDAGDPGLLDSLGRKDIVVTNRFLCHMAPNQAEACLSNLARLVKSGGISLFLASISRCGAKLHRSTAGALCRILLRRSTKGTRHCRVTGLLSTGAWSL
jgi:Methyltransferase domain